MKDFLNNSQIKSKNQRTGFTEYAEFYPKLSKHIIDRIDEIMKSSYSFSNEEALFIKNYAIEFRMGDDE
jgi:hypothetical protein